MARPKKIKENVQEEKQNADLKELIGGMQQIVSAVKDLSSRMSKIENEVPVPKKAEDKPVQTAQITEDSVFPVPIDYRKAVENKFNKKFRVKVEPNDQLPSFKFTIIVPEEYSPLKGAELQMAGGEDKRMRVITYSEGINGVLQWVEKVYNNLDVEARSKIQADRFNL